MKAAARLFARETIEKVYLNGLKIACGCHETMDDLLGLLKSIDVGRAMKGNLQEMDLIAQELVK